jgi:hypothetical protein
MSLSQIAWPAVLDRVQAALQQALAEVDARREALPASPAPAARPWEEALRRARERAEALEACAAGAAGRVAGTDADLAAAEEALRQWIRAAEAARAKLADWAGRAVG